MKVYTIDFVLYCIWWLLTSLLLYYGFTVKTGSLTVLRYICIDLLNLKLFFYNFHSLFIIKLLSHILCTSKRIHLKKKKIYFAEIKINSFYNI